MSAHAIPDDGTPHAPTTECGCGPQRRWQSFNGTVRPVFVHVEQHRPPHFATGGPVLAGNAADDRVLATLSDCGYLR